MSLMKSILLGSAAGIVAVASAQAADLPTRKAAPAEYVKICNVGGMAGFIIPGSDTCLKIGGYITAHFTAGNTETGYSWGGAPGTASRGASLVASPASLRPDIGYNMRFNLSVDTRTNTAYGVLRGYAELQVDHNNGFDGFNPSFASGANNGSGGTNAYMNLAYVQWAGITAGKAPSFFSFYGGGEGWNNLFSPDQQGFNQPLLFAYTATFGGGFSATLAAQSPGSNGYSGGGTNINVDTANYGMSAPDIVGNLRVDQSWGSAQVSGVAHQVHVFDDAGGSGFAIGAPGQNTWGWAVNGGVKINVPSFGPGDFIQAQVTYSKNAIWYSGIPDGMNGENGAVNGNGLAMTVGDTYFAGPNAAGANVWSTPTTFTVSATAEHHFTPQWSLDPEIAYTTLHWSNSLGQLSNNADSIIGGVVGHWDPIPLLDFEVDLLYQTTHQSTPGNWGTGSITGTNGVTVTPAAFKNTSDGFAGRFEITRSW
jgi:Porin subfamily